MFHPLHEGATGAPATGTRRRHALDHWMDKSNRSPRLEWREPEADVTQDVGGTSGGARPLGRFHLAARLVASGASAGRIGGWSRNLHE
jgi:hypothetical protein